MCYLSCIFSFIELSELSEFNEKIEIGKTEMNSLNSF